MNSNAKHPAVNTKGDALLCAIFLIRTERCTLYKQCCYGVLGSTHRFAVLTAAMTVSYSQPARQNLQIAGESFGLIELATSCWYGTMLILGSGDDA